MISIIVAVGNNYVIGKDNKMPWRLPLDLKNFKKITTGSIVIMGRKTLESMDKPLPDRENWVITSDSNYKAPGCRIFHSIREVVDSLPEKEVFIIGGEQIYRGFFPYADRLYLTKIHEDFEADTFFPEVKENEWKLVSRVRGERNEKNPYDYDFLILEKIK